MITFEQFQTNVERWQAERGIYEHGTASAQALKGVSEAGELADAVIKGSCDARCGKPAKRWFGNTSRATCGELQCIAILEASYDASIAE